MPQMMNSLFIILLFCACSFGANCGNGPCLNGGLTEVGSDGVCKCTCQRGYSGAACEIITNATTVGYDACFGIVCVNGGFPVPDGLGSCRCACPAGYSSANCSVQDACVLTGNCAPCDPCLFGTFSTATCSCVCEGYPNPSYAYGYLCEQQLYCYYNTNVCTCSYDQSVGGCAWWTPVKTDGTCSDLPPICAYSSFTKIGLYGGCVGTPPGPPPCPPN